MFFYAVVGDSGARENVGFSSTFNGLKVEKLWGELIELALSLLQGTCLLHQRLPYVSLSTKEERALLVKTKR